MGVQPQSLRYVEEPGRSWERKGSPRPWRSPGPTRKAENPQWKKWRQPIVKKGERTQERFEEVEYSDSQRQSGEVVPRDCIG